MEKNSSQNFKAMNNKFESRMETIERQMKKNHVEVSKVLNQHTRIMTNMSAGMGRQFEKYNAEWVKKNVFDTVGKNVEVFIGRVEMDLERKIHSDTTQVEIDIFVPEPFIVGEATTYLGKDEWNKIKKFHQVGKWLEHRYNGKPRMMLFCMSIHSELEQRVKEYCEAHGIELVCSIKE
jgi:hypothetical protein